MINRPLTAHPLFSAYAALACVCLFWGTTYLGIRIAIETIAPDVLVSVRYLISGSLMLVGAAAKGACIPRGRELWRTALFGIIVLGIGNGALAFAELWVPTGWAALFVTTSPFWFVGIQALMTGKESLHAPTIRAMLVALSGAALLLGPAAMSASSAGIIGGFFLLQFGCAGWAYGSLLQRRAPSTAHPFVSGAVQQLATGIVFAIPASLHWSNAHFTPKTLAAVAYLTVFGSIVGYSAYIFAMDRLPVAVASLYTYVNPVVAVILGAMFDKEPYGIREIIAMLLIFIGVALVKRAETRAARLPDDPSTLLE